MKKYGFGVDIGGTTCKLGLMDASGIILDKWEIKTNTVENGLYILNDIANEIENKLKEKNIRKEEVEGIGLGVPGPIIDSNTVNHCINLG